MHQSVALVYLNLSFPSSLQHWRSSGVLSRKMLIYYNCQGKYVPPDRAEVATEESNDDTEEDAGDTDQSNVKIEDVNEETHEQQSNQEPDIDLD